MSTRRLSIYYRKGDQSPVSPEIDQRVDIAKPIVDEYIDYLGEETSKVNSIPINTTKVAASYGVTEDAQQKTFTDETVSGINKTTIDTNFASNSPLGTLIGFTDEYRNLTTPEPFYGSLIAPDTLGVNKPLKDNSTRFFRVKNYTSGINNDPTRHERNVNATLISTVGYNDPNKFISTDGQPTNKQDQKIKLGHLFYQRGNNGENLGKYARSSNVKTYNETLTAAEPLTIEQLSNIGVNIIFEAVQGQAGFDFVVSTTGSIVEAEARMLLPSEQRLGKRVSLGRFTPAYQYKKITGVEKPANPAFIDNTKDIQSYGSFYNVYNQFDALVPAGQIALAVALILGFVVLLGIVSGFNINANRNTVAESANPDNPENFVDLDYDRRKELLGSSVLQGGVFPLELTGTDFLTQFLGISNIFNYTRHGFRSCLSAGTQEFFGFAINAGTGAGVGSQLANSSFKVLTESGRLNVILRELLRSGITLIENLVADPSQLASITGAGNLIRKIRDLKIVRFINVLIGIGDKIRFESDLRVIAQQNQNNGGGSFGVSGSTSYVDSLPDSRPFYVSKSRLSNGEIAWSNRTAGMAMLPLLVNNNPKSFAKSGQRSDGKTNWDDMNITIPQVDNSGITELINLSDGDKTKFYNASVENDRLPRSVVESIEEALESDYMPFYIHDLRTNEILAFHAFLEDASEDFQIEYSAQEGYGRMDKVQIYKGTSRTISVNFKMAAMNESDHDLMWYKINRLAMMIYPQWTQGRKVGYGDNIKFIQPFSQIPGATPVVRLRLGDLYKSNYSKMAVARLFGITTLEDYNVDVLRVKETEESNKTAANPPAPNSPQQTTINEQNQNRISLLRNRSKLFGTVRRSAPNPRNQSRAASSTPQILFEDCFRQGQTIVLKAVSSYSNDFVRLPNRNLIPTGNTRGTSGRIFATVENIRNNQLQVRFIRYKFDYQDPASPLETIERNNGRDNIVNLTPNVVNNFLDREASATIEEAYQRNEVAQFNNTLNNLAETDVGLVVAAGVAGVAGAAAGLTEPQQQKASTLLNPSTFYDDTKNPIMKAFKSSGGKGLAGVITSFKVDYGDAKGNWGLDGSEFLRAPKFVTIQLQMAVIHDITPGLDARGIMNAPIWPVGRQSHYFTNNGPPIRQTTVPAANQPTTNYESPNDIFDVSKRVLYINRKG